ncbi:MAG: N-acetylmuramoyl-L-alanine amidase [Planctomycetes bacterium]|nr:N-acetylmuramoyl-L-alanine amidase [Planctomycetota bacterium]
MANQLRVWKVLIVLLISMTSGAIILMSLSAGPLSAGPFCLSSYYRLVSADTAIHSKATQSHDRWKRIEIFYSETRMGGIEWLASINGFKDAKELDCHFVICNGHGGKDGQIQPTEKWQEQASVKPQRNWHSGQETIRVCVIASGVSCHPTDCQIKRVDSLVQALSRRFDIPSNTIHYPGDMSRGPSY